MDSNFNRGLAQLGVFLLIAIGLPALVPHHEKKMVSSARDAVSIDDQLSRLGKEKPGMVITGDSMVPCRVDPDVLGKEMGLNVSLLHFHGSGSAAWFLVFKNIVAEMEHPPKYMVFFFRDTYFHLPKYRTTGQRLALIESASRGAEPELKSVLTGKAGSTNPILDNAQDILDATWEVDDYRDVGADEIRNIALRCSTLGTERARRMAYMNEIFSINHLRRDLAGDIPDIQGGENAVYAEPIPQWSADPLLTFLPHIEGIAREKGIKLIFYRVKQRRHTQEGGADSPELTAYLEGFRKWAEKSGNFFADETRDPAIKIDHFADGDHTKEEENDFLSTRVAAAIKAGLEKKNP